MALTTCIDCRGEVSHRASRCPHCDCPRPTARQRRVDRVLMAGVAVIVGLMAFRILPIFVGFFAELS